MKNLYSAQTAETISLKVEQSPVWEMILGIAVYPQAVRTVHVKTIFTLFHQCFPH